MALLISRDDIALYRQITDSTHALKRINQHINDAQFMDLQRLLGADFYNDLERNITATNYVTLLDGGTYTYNNTTYTNVGLKVVLAHYAYSRYVLNGSQVDTAFGYVQKSNDNSVPVTLEAKKNMSKMNEQVAFNYWENVKLFLDRNTTAYPLWKELCKPISTFKFSKIG